MKLTKIKRKELKTGDLYCETIGMFQCPIFVQRYPGDTEQPTSLQQFDVLRIDVPDYVHELTQFSWKIKQLNDKVESLIAHNKRKGALMDVIKTRDGSIEELEKINVRLTHKAEGLEDENAGLIKVISRGQGVDHTRLEECRQSNRDLKTIAANSESYTHRMDELVASCKSDAKQQDRRLKDLISANGALAADVRSCEGVRTKNRELNSRVDELEAELNDMSREMSNRCVCSGCAGSQRLELLDDIEKIVNPIIKSGEYAHSVESARVLAQAMWDLCHCLIDFRRKHNIIG